MEGKDYRIKVVAKIREDLSQDDKEYIEEYIQHWQNVYHVQKLSEDVYVKPQKEKENDDIIDVTFFSIVLEDEIKYLEKLEFYNYHSSEYAIIK